MKFINVTIVRFIDETQPGIVACEFLDAEGRKQTLIDKTAMFTDKMLWWDSEYPQPGVAQCDVLARWQDDAGRKLARVAMPYILESSDENGEFVVFESQVLDDLHCT